MTHHHSRGGVFSSNIYVGNRKGFYGLGQYADPWTQRKAAEARRGIARAKGMGQESPDSAEPPPPKKMSVGLMIGWTAVVLGATGIFYMTMSGAPAGRQVSANRRRRRTSRKRRSTQRRRTKRRRTSRRLSRNAMINKVIHYGYSRHHKKWWVEAPNTSVRFYGTKDKALDVASDLADRYDMRKRRNDKRLARHVEAVRKAIAQSRRTRSKRRR